MGQKMSVEDAKQLMDSRSTLVGLEKAVTQIESAVASDFSTKRDLQGVAQQVQNLRQQLRSEIYQARYVRAVIDWYTSSGSHASLTVALVSIDLERWTPKFAADDRVEHAGREHECRRVCLEGGI